MTSSHTLKSGVSNNGGKKMFEIPSTKKKVAHCPDCGTKILDEFPEVGYVNCSGCPRIFNRLKEVKPNSSHS